MFDLDNFKIINDTHGHSTGDEVLKLVVNTIKENIRRSDIFARWGGEEFIIILPGTASEPAAHIAEKLRQKVQNTYVSKIGYVTCSFGVYTAQQADSLQSIFEEVDKRVYQAKKEGKNRVCQHLGKEMA